MPELYCSNRDVIEHVALRKDPEEQNQFTEEQRLEDLEIIRQSEVADQKAVRAVAPSCYPKHYFPSMDAARDLALAEWLHTWNPTNKYLN